FDISHQPACIAKWDGTTWSVLGSGLGNQVRTLSVLSNGDLVAGGDFTVGGGPANYIARWNGSQWTSMGSEINGKVVSTTRNASGAVYCATGTTVRGWSGSAWIILGSYFNQYVFVVKSRTNGDLVAGGEFTGNSGYTIHGIARWDGTS